MDQMVVDDTVPAGHQYFAGSMPKKSDVVALLRTALKARTDRGVFIRSYAAHHYPSTAAKLHGRRRIRGDNKDYDEGGPLPYYVLYTFAEVQGLVARY